MSAAQRPRQPWPLKWIAVAILVIIVPYTFIRLHYSKPTRAFEPYADMKDRANTLRLLSAGFQRVSLEAERPADPLRNNGAAPITPTAGGLPAPLAGSLVDTPLLPAEIVTVTAAPTANTLFSYPIDFTCTLPDNKQQLGGAQLYLREGELFILPTYEKIEGQLLARTRENLIRLTVPAGALKPGRYHVVLIGARASKAWTLTVQ